MDNIPNVKIVSSMVILLAYFFHLLGNGGESVSLMGPLAEEHREGSCVMRQRES